MVSSEIDLFNVGKLTVEFSKYSDCPQNYASYVFAKRKFHHVRVTVTFQPIGLTRYKIESNVRDWFYWKKKKKWAKNRIPHGPISIVTRFSRGIRKC